MQGAFSFQVKNPENCPLKGEDLKKSLKKRLHVDEFTPWRYRGNDGVCPPGK
jgi:hypothetical protein